MSTNKILLGFCKKNTSFTRDQQPFVKTRSNMACSDKNIIKDMKRMLERGVTGQAAIAQYSPPLTQKTLYARKWGLAKLKGPHYMGTVKLVDNNFAD